MRGQPVGRRRCGDVGRANVAVLVVVVIVGRHDLHIGNDDHHCAFTSYADDDRNTRRRCCVRS